MGRDFALSNFLCQEYYSKTKIYHAILEVVSYVIILKKIVPSQVTTVNLTRYFGINTSRFLHVSQVEDD